ncbi:MAG: hypothetical protein J3K34DRAFT_409483 [Monoraphidium minutum]|nr:MAG: hypothetical protein J3K34DRAFT_409483 [Monoraphidium minutum]
MTRRAHSALTARACAPQPSFPTLPCHGPSFLPGIPPDLRARALRASRFRFASCSGPSFPPLTCESPTDDPLHTRLALSPPPIPCPGKRAVRTSSHTQRQLACKRFRPARPPAALATNPTAPLTCAPLPTAPHWQRPAILTLPLPHCRQAAARPPGPPAPPLSCDIQAM